MKKETKITYTFTPDQVKDILIQHVEYKYGITPNKVNFRIEKVYTDYQDTYGSSKLTEINCICTENKEDATH